MPENNFDLELESDLPDAVMRAPGRLPADTLDPAQLPGCFPAATPAGRNLADYDFELLLDRSGSMARPIHSDRPGGPSRWTYAAGVTTALAAKAVIYDTNGIVVVVFSSPGASKIYDEVTDAARVAAIFAAETPDGSTDTAGVLRDRLNHYFDGPREKKLLLFILTDGEPNSEADLIAVIKDAQRRVRTADEVSIQFIQVGDDKKAEAYLKRLDDGLGEPDLVDTTKFKDIEELGYAELVDKTIDD